MLVQVSDIVLATQTLTNSTVTFDKPSLLAKDQNDH